MGDASEPYSRLAGVYDELVVDPCFAEWASFLDRTWAGDNVRSVLDVCCGTGLMTAELVARGLAVVGVDASPEMLARARVLLGPDVRLERHTLPDLPVDGPFDAAVSTFDGFNYLTLADLRTTFAALSRCLRAGGWLVFDAHTDAMLAFIDANPVIEGDDADRRFVLTTTADVTARRAETTIELTAPDDSFTETHVQYFHSDADLRAALADAGFTVLAVRDEYSDAPADDTTLRATWIARRESAP